MKSSDNQNPFALSVGDLMAALLLLFVLILMGVLLQLQEQVENQNVIVEKFDNLNEQLYQDLRDEFKDDLPRWHATLIDTTLSIRFEEPKMLFDDGQWKLKDTFKLILNDFFPRYLNVIQRPEYYSEISEIRIEGHTSSKGFGTKNDNYLFNIGLSQKRAKSTLAYLFNSINLQEKDKDWCISKLTANGLSWSKLIYSDNGEEDENLSRRVEFRVKIDAERKLRELSKMLKGVK